MKKFNLSLLTLIVFVMLTATAYSQPANRTPPTNAPSATFNRVWVDYDVKEDGIDGMRIHADFKVYRMKGADSYLQIRFQKRDGTPLLDKNNKLVHEDGSVAVFKEMKPGYDPSVYEDLAVFMPYDELELNAAGKYALRMDVDVILQDGTLVQHLTFYNFDFTQPEKVPTATFNSARVDYDVTESGQYGMRVHLNFSVYDMKDISGYASVLFQKRDGTKILTNNDAFRNTAGQVGVFKAIKPGFATTDYKDLTLFIPYKELNLTPGAYKLTMDIDVIYEDGTLIQHMSSYDFDYTKQ